MGFHIGKPSPCSTVRVDSLFWLVGKPGSNDMVVKSQGDYDHV